MTPPILFFQRLLDQQEIEVVQLGQVMGVLPRIGLIGIDLKRNRRPALTHRGNRLEVPPRFDF